MSWFMNLRIARKLLVGFGAVLLIATAVNTATLVTVHQRTEAARWTQHTYTVLETASEALASLVDMETGYRGFLITGEDNFLEPYQAGMVGHKRELQELRGLTSDNPVQVARWDDLLERAQQWQNEVTEPGMAIRRAVTAGTAAEGDVRAFEMSGEGKRHFDGMREVFATAIETERALLADRSAANEAAGTRLQLIVTGGTALVVLLGVVIAMGIARLIAGPVRRMADAAAQLATGDVDVQVRSESRDEIGELASSFQVMVESQRTLATTAERVARGDRQARAKPRSERDVLGKAFEQLAQVLDRLVSETTALAEAGRSGNLSVRADTGAFDGGFRELVDGVNKTLDAVLEPITEASDVLQRVANRDLGVRMVGSYHGDHARIKNALNEAVENLQNALSEVASASGQVAGAAEQITETSQQLAETTGEQAGSLEEISASLEELSSMAVQNSSNAREALTLSQAARAATETGVERMGRLSDAMNQIKQSSDSTARIVKTIDEIAFQTNLLALNAAVEAARAGDAGKGFAVVAEEVRSLAMRSAEAARQTADLIEEAVRKAEGGVELNHEVMSSLEEMRSQVGRTGEVVAAIAAASEQQTIGVQEINAAVEQMNQVTQNTAAASEEGASTAEELSSQAESLQELVGGFILSAGATRGTAARPSPSRAGAGSTTAQEQKGEKGRGGRNRLPAQLLSPARTGFRGEEALTYEF